jgi:hypothetical protein
MTPIYAAAILATIGHIANFEDAGHLKAYFGWAPKRAQTGVSSDRASLTRGGSREMKKVMYLVAWNAVKRDKRFMSLHCTYEGYPLDSSPFWKSHKRMFLINPERAKETFSFSFFLFSISFDTLVERR